MTILSTTTIDLESAFQELRHLAFGIAPNSVIAILRVTRTRCHDLIRTNAEGGLADIQARLEPSEMFLTLLAALRDGQTDPATVTNIVGR